MNSIKKWWIGAAGAATLVAIIGAGAVMAQTPSSTPKTSPTIVPGTTVVPGTNAPGNPAATFKSNEDPTHEANETAQQEADEDAGKGPHGGVFRPNEDPTHEAGETAAQEAAEDAGQPPARHAPSGAPTTPGSSQTPAGNNG